MAVGSLVKRVIIVRHGESEANVDKTLYARVPDHEIQLTGLGYQQSIQCGKVLHDLLEKKYQMQEGSSLQATMEPKWKVLFYTSPFARTLNTLKEIGKSFERDRIVDVKEDARIRELNYGDFLGDTLRMETLKHQREIFGHFYYKFPQGGESPADVYDRIASFVQSMQSDVGLLTEDGVTDEVNVIVITHGLTSKVLMMRMLGWSVEEFEAMKTHDNCEIRVLELGNDKSGEYTVATHHSVEEMKSWRFSCVTVEEQLRRVEGIRGKDLSIYFGHSSKRIAPNEECRVNGLGDS